MSESKVFTSLKDLTFVGAVSGAKFTLKAYQQIRVAPDEIRHIAPCDLAPGIHERPIWQPKQSAE